MDGHPNNVAMAETLGAKLEPFTWPDLGFTVETIKKKIFNF
jgi:hypothetical protein